MANREAVPSDSPARGQPALVWGLLAGAILLQFGASAALRVVTPGLLGFYLLWRAWLVSRRADGRQPRDLLVLERLLVAVAVVGLAVTCWPYSVGLTRGMAHERGPQLPLLGGFGAAGMLAIAAWFFGQGARLACDVLGLPSLGERLAGVGVSCLSGVAVFLGSAPMLPAMGQAVVAVLAGVLCWRAFAGRSVSATDEPATNWLVSLLAPAAVGLSLAFLGAPLAAASWISLCSVRLVLCAGVFLSGER